ncbi:hypothetical protein DL98DRAFT_629364 [Cadophora sp. DSE1049]|nr:hypothetical protein DL98DRAFT_629364 [Cadophora sp. DSE1049]
MAGVSPQALDLGGPFQNGNLKSATRLSELIISSVLARIPESQMAIASWNLTPVSNVFMRRAFKVLPPKDETLNLIKKFFQGFNSAFPLFDQAAFMSTFESPDTNINDPGWWACLNVVLALTHRFRGATGLDMEEDREAWGYFQNALVVSNQLATMHSTLSSVRCQEPGLNAAEFEQRKRVFWIAYSLDKDISLQTGQPPTQDDDNMDVELPFKNNGAPTRPDEPNNADFFHFRARLAMIQGQIYKRLCSVKATQQSVTERVMAAKELETMLQIWRASIPINFQQDCFRPNLQVPTLDPNLRPVILQLAYFNSLTTIYGSLPILPMYNEIQGSEDPVEVHIMSAPIACAAEARKAIKLLQATPQRNYACIW